MQPLIISSSISKGIILGSNVTFEVLNVLELVDLPFALYVGHHFNQTLTFYYLICFLGSLRVLGSIGHPIQHTEFNIVDSETGEVLPPGFKGIVRMDCSSSFGRRSPRRGGVIVLEGRAKDTIVLSSGGSETDDAELSDCTLMALRYHELADQRKGGN
ncbi:hypothetical protein F3Y22_tig00110332pilonHSYRG00108 [Hibiscus syriacus]|uniref:Uncharacterized protein n=1 Tax=Hibiscus syriacus TaxID=106335 RepID=A0A6A3AVH4_HIBSY|nr:hypothetical protein F3Y22_tig00110332pilonHSYRG00108 [Hibiscus syriacus]